MRNRRMCRNEFMWLKQSNGGAFRERHGTCKHVEFHVPPPNPIPQKNVNFFRICIEED